MHRRFYITIFLFLAAVSCLAQSVVWEMEPTNSFNEVEYIGFDMFQTTGHNGKKGVIDQKGSMIVEYVCDEITPFYENFALLLVKSKNKVQVIGNLSTDGKCNIFSQNHVYYTLQGQAFYSCDMLTVEDEQGNKGYIDLEGNPVIGFGNGIEFSKIKPFSEGFAAVFDKNKQYMLIDKSGKKEQFSFPNVVTRIPNGTNVYQGKVFVIDTQNEFYSYDVFSKKTCVKERPKTITPDYLFRFSGKGTDVPYATLPAANPNIQLQESEKGFGYKHNNKVLLPGQFDKASSFIDNIAIVKIDNKYGILRFYPEGSTPFAVETVSPTAIDYTAGKSVVCKFKISAPISYNVSRLSVTVDDSKATCLDSNIFTFNYNPSSSGKQSVTVKISDKGLMLLSSPLEYVFNEVKPQVVSEEKSKQDKDKQENEKKKEKKSKEDSKVKEQKQNKKNDNNTNKSSDKQKDKNAPKEKTVKENPKKTNKTDNTKKETQNKDSSKKKKEEKKKKDIKLF